MKTKNREQMMDWIGKYMRFVRESEHYSGSQGGIWVSGEDVDEYIKGKKIYDYYSSDKDRQLGVCSKWEAQLNKRGWFSEWYDCGTVMIWKI
tara:strand:+ start:724 stop:999 length:276 start_codon:yes stop_codon:yes gene_type:complete